MTPEQQKEHRRKQKLKYAQSDKGKKSQSSCGARYND